MEFWFDEDFSKTLGRDLCYLVCKIAFVAQKNPEMKESTNWVLITSFTQFSKKLTNIDEKNISFVVKKKFNFSVVKNEKNKILKAKSYKARDCNKTFYVILVGVTSLRKKNVTIILARKPKCCSVRHFPHNFAKLFYCNINLWLRNFHNTKVINISFQPSILARLSIF